jgi:hypothetical protein
VHGDIIPILNERPNITFTTSNPISIQKCKEVKAPLMLTITDDFMYVSDIIESGIVDVLRKSNKIVMFTSISTNGI